AVAPAFGVRRLVAAVFRERKPTHCGFCRAASKSANKLAHSKRCCDRQTRPFTPYMSCPQCAKHIPLRGERVPAERVRGALHVSRLCTARYWKNSVRHQVKNDVDAERIGAFLRELVKEIIILAFALPAVAVVAIVRGDHHDSCLVV